MGWDGNLGVGVVLEGVDGGGSLLGCHITSQEHNGGMLILLLLG